MSAANGRIVGPRVLKPSPYIFDELSNYPDEPDDAEREKEAEEMDRFMQEQCKRTAQPHSKAGWIEYKPKA
jgi:hypothetical protein